MAERAPMLPARDLGAVLRRRESDGPAPVRVVVGSLVAIVDPGTVAVRIGSATVSVPHLASYAPATEPGEPVYLLSAGSLLIALGTVWPEGP
jgi:hypothetical protein